MALDIYAILRKRFPVGQYALMAEVSDKAGFERSRSADFISVGLWPNRGLAINGIELKSYRSDWLNELKKPAKAENIFQYCDYFWLLTTDNTIARIEEIPATWGWMIIKGNKIFTVKEAPKLTPRPISNHFLAAMLKRAESKDGFIRRSEVQNEIDAARISGKNDNERHRLQTENQFIQLRDEIKAFTEASGINLNRRWGINHKKIGEAVKFIEDGGAENLKNDLIRLEQTAKQISESISKNIKLLTDLN